MNSASIDALHLLNKKAGISSFNALSQLKRHFGIKKVGHVGTLDPFATGLLIALSGKLTKAAFLFENADKEYLAEFRFGKETDTLDTEGKIVGEAPIPSFNTIENASAQFHGEISQRPPSYSAIKINGQRAYKEARKGKSVFIPKRTVHIHQWENILWDPPCLTVLIRCSKGTYIRSLARDIGRAAGSLAYCLNLQRTAIGSFRLEEINNSEDFRSISPLDFFPRIGVPIREIDFETSEFLRKGRSLLKIPRLPHFETNNILFVSGKSPLNPVALVEKEGERLSYRIVFDSVGT